MIFRFSGSVCVSNVVKIIGLIAGLLCSSVSLVANNPIANRFVKIGGLTNNFPYSYANINDILDGFSYDLSEAVMHYLHLKHEFKLYDLTYTLNHTEHHYNDLILSECDLSMISVMPSIDSGRYYNSIPYCQLNSYIISKKGAVFKEINDIMGKKLIIPKNCLFKERLSYFNSNHVEEISPVLFTSLGIKMVADGKVDYMLIDDLALHEFLDNIEKYNLVLSPLEGNTFDLCFSSENKELIEEVNGAIQELKSNGTIGFLHDKWFYKKENKLSYLYGVLCFLLLLLAVMLIIIYILRKVLKVNKRDVDTAQAHNEELSIVLNILMKNSNIEIYMFEEPTKNLFILKDGSFVPSGVNLGEVETRIHPDDLEQYNGDYIKVISGQVNYLISTLRIYNVETKAYRYYELAVVPSEKNDGKMVTAYYYSLRDVTDVMKDLQEKEETIGSFNLALRSVNLIRWKYDIKKETIKLLYTDSKYKEMPLNTFLCAISWEDRELFMQYINNVIQENEMEDIIMRMMLTNEEEEYRIYNISSYIQWDRNGRPENIYGIVNDITEITKY
ncbi:MAG: transporter substrate-binding domain-containing protein, partial [Marinifilaceae bacterium]